MVLEKLGRSLDSAIRKIRKLPQVDKDAINALIQDLQRALLSSDVKVELVFEMTEIADCQYTTISATKNILLI